MDYHKFRTDPLYHNLFIDKYIKENWILKNKFDILFDSDEDKLFNWCNRVDQSRSNFFDVMHNKVGADHRFT